MIDQQEELHPFSEAHYQLAMKAAGIGMWDWDILHNKQYWNAECRAIMGADPRAEPSFEYFFSLVHPDDREAIKRNLAEGERLGKKQRIEHRIIWPDGSVHWVAAQGDYTYDECGRAIRLLGVVFDITAQKEAEEERLGAERQVREILESVGEAFAHLDRDWRFTYVNSRAADIMQRSEGVPLMRVLGRTVWEVYPALIGTDGERFLRKVMETRQPVSFEIYHASNRLWYDFHVYPTEDGGITNFITDITERKSLERERTRLLARERKARKAAEAARQQSEELIKQLEYKQAFFKAVVEQAPSGLMIVNASSGQITFCNEEACKLLGLKPLDLEDFTDYRHYTHLHPDGTLYQPEEYPLMRALLKGEVVIEEEMLYEGRDGKLIHIAANAAPIRDAQGHMLAGVLTFHDITERYELERKKDEFIGMASHELRTPLTSLRGNLQLAERRLKQIQESGTYLTSAEGSTSLERLIVWIESALRQVKAESRLINDLLDATRIQTENLHISLEPCNLVQAVSDAVNDMRVAAYTRTIHLELPEQKEIPVLADSVRIEQVVTNYLSNALKYSAEREPVTVGLALEGHEARVRVKDAGLGLSPEAQRSIWHRFRRPSSFAEYTGLGVGGLGLGLYINQAVIQQHGGRVGVESAVGQGSTFWFTLPLVEA